MKYGYDFMDEQEEYRYLTPRRPKETESEKWNSEH